jgi:hypothetical protein
MQSKWQQACTKKNLKKFTYIRANILSDDVYLGATIRKLEGGVKKIAQEKQKENNSYRDFSIGKIIS